MCIGGVLLKNRKKTIDKIKKQFIQAVPTIVFFLFLFYTILIFFGVQYMTIVSFITIIFKIQYNKSFTIKKMLSITVQLLVLSMLAFFATLHPALSVLLNCIVPFILVFVQASQFNQKGYMANMMAFVLLQLRPVGWSGIWPLTIVLCYSILVLAVALIIVAFTHRHKDSYVLIKKANTQLYDLTQLILHHQDPAHQIQAMILTQQALYKEAYQSRGLTYVITKSGKLHYMFALLMQRTIYFFESRYEQDMLEKENDHSLFATFSAYTKHLSNILNDKKTYQKEGEILLQEASSKEDNDICAFIQNFMRLFMIILDIREEGKDNQPMREWRMPQHLHPLEQLKAKFHLDRFEFRFACRLSCVMVIGFLFSNLTQWNHSYWLPLNAIVLLQPMYEESNYRLKTRFIGTVAGSIGVYILLSIFPGINAHFIIATIMVTCMYTATPGSWMQAMFSTCFALTMTTMALQQEIAIELRITYVVLAIILVLIVNRFLFPTSMTTQFRYNLQRMFHMQHAYLMILRSALEKQIDYGVICDALTSYHMVYAQMHQHVSKLDGEEKAFYQDILLIFWRMAAEMEQLLFLVNQQRIGVDNQRELWNYIKVNHYVLQHIQMMMNLGEVNLIDVKDIVYKRKIEGEPSLSLAMEQYAKHISRLYYRTFTYYKDKNKRITTE